MPPSLTEAVSRGWNGSATSYCLSSPVPQQDTYSQRSSTDRSMSEISGGTAPKGFSAGGRSSASAGSAGMVITLLTAQRPPSLCHDHTDPGAGCGRPERRQLAGVDLDGHAGARHGG